MIQINFIYILKLNVRARHKLIHIEFNVGLLVRHKLNFITVNIFNNLFTKITPIL